MSDSKDSPQPAVAEKQRDSVIDVAKGIGILFVVGIHTTNNSARLYTVPHTLPWWVLVLINRFLCYAVPMFLLISAILAARSLIFKPQVIPFYRRRLVGALWPYLVWSGIYFCARLIKEPASRKLETGSIYGIHITAPALFVHAKARLLDLLWGKAYFHLYFMVVLVGMVILLPLALTYVRRRKPGFYEMLATAFLIQAAIIVVQHNTALLPFPASTVFWYIGSLLPGAWIGANWDEFKVAPNRYALVLSILTAVSGFLYFKGEIGVILGIKLDNYTALGSQTVFASCLSILAFSLSFAVAKRPEVQRVLLPLGLVSLQVYLIHPGIILLLEKPIIVQALRATYLGPLLSATLMFAITFGLIALIRLLRLEKPLFGR